MAAMDEDEFDRYVKRKYGKDAATRGNFGDAVTAGENAQMDSASAYSALLSGKLSPLEQKKAENRLTPEQYSEYLREKQAYKRGLTPYQYNSRIGG